MLHPVPPDGRALARLGSAQDSPRNEGRPPPRRPLERRVLPTAESVPPSGEASAARGTAPAPAAGRGLGRPAALFLLGLALLLHARDLGGPFPDGQAGNCGAMFALFARNAAVYGASAVLVPVLDPVPAEDGVPRTRYTHHPPGLPWLVMLASRLPLALPVAAKLAALLLTVLGAGLLADLAARLCGSRAGLAAGVLYLALPAGLRYGLLVNYETAALPPLLYVTRVLLFERGKAALGGTWAALSDWIALLPLLLVLAGRRVCRARWWRAVLAGGGVTLGVVFLARSGSPGSVAATLQQALQATFLSPVFDGAAWAAALPRFFGELYGLALLPALLAPFFLRQLGCDPLLARTLFVLGATGLFNVLVFAHHATTHEHFSLILLPYVALATSALLFAGSAARERGRARLAFAALVVLLGAGFWQESSGSAARRATTQTELADAFAAVAPQDAVYLRPAGTSLVFLERARRHLVPFPPRDLDHARTLADVHRRRFALDLPTRLALERDAPVPAWLAPLGEGDVRGSYRFWTLPPD